MAALRSTSGLWPPGDGGRSARGHRHRGRTAGRRQCAEMAAPGEPVPGSRVQGAPRNWMLSHPKFVELTALNVADSTHVYNAFLVYLDLLEGRNWHEVTCKGLRDLQQICLYGREREGHSSQVVVPTSVNMSYSHERIKQIMRRTRRAGDAPDVPPSVLLAIVESDSTIVYYKLTDGFVVPDPPDLVEDVDNKQWRKRRRKV